MNWLSSLFSGTPAEDATVLVAFISTLGLIVTNMGWVRRHKNKSDTILSLEDENLQFRKDYSLAEVRLDKVDPLRFQQRLETAEEQGAFDVAEAEAAEFFSWQNTAIAEAARVLATKEIIESGGRGVEAFNDAARFVEVGLAAIPGETRLVALSKELKQRIEAKEVGIDFELLPPEGATDVWLNKMSQVEYAKGNYAIAELLARRSVPLALKRTGAKSSNYAGAIGQHSVLLSYIGRIDLAEELSRRAIDIYKVTLGPDSIEYAKSLGSLASLMLKAQNPSDSEPYLKEAINVIEKLPENHDAEKTRLYGMLGGMFHLSNRPEQAEREYLRALELGQKTKGHHRRNFAAVLEKYANLLELTNRIDEAKKRYRETVDAFEDALGTQHPDFLGAKRGLERFLSEHGSTGD